MGARRAVDQRLAPGYAAQHAVTRIVSHHDRIVDQHPHRNDESGQRGTVQAHAEELHNKQRAADREDQRTADQHSRTETHNQHNQGDNDRHRLQQVDHKRIVGLLRDTVLRIERHQVDPDRDQRHQRTEALFDQFTGFDHVFRRIGRNADPDGGPAVEQHQRRRGFGISLFDTGNVPQADLPSLRRGENLVADVVEVLVSSRLDQFDLHFAREFFAARNKRILRLKRLNHFRRSYKKIVQRRKAHINVHHPALLAEKGHFLHALDGHERRFDPLRPAAHLLIGKPFSRRKAVINPEHIAEIVAHGDRRRILGHLGLYIEHLAAQLVPHLRHLVGRRGRIQLDHDLRKPVIRFGGDLIDATHRLNFTPDRFGHQLFDLLGRRSRVTGDDRSAFDDERRILFLAELAERNQAADEQQRQEKVNHLSVIEGISGKIHSIADSIRLVFPLSFRHFQTFEHCKEFKIDR